MRRSKLEVYTKILEVLDTNGPMGVTKITLKARINYALLKPMLDTLTEKAVVEERAIKKDKIVFSINQKGKAVFNQLNQYGKLGKHSKKQNTKLINAILIEA